MKCDRCGKDNDKVTQTSYNLPSEYTRRRRVCLSCGHKFTTWEVKWTRLIPRGTLFSLKQAQPTPIPQLEHPQEIGASQSE